MTSPFGARRRTLLLLLSVLVLGPGALAVAKDAGTPPDSAKETSTPKADDAKPADDPSAEARGEESAGDELREPRAGGVRGGSSDRGAGQQQEQEQKQRGRIRIVKDARPNTSTEFQFSSNLGNFALVDDGTSSRSRVFADLDAGVYNITEPDLGEGVEPYELTGISCTGGPAAVRLAERSVQIRLEEGGDVVCTFVNEREPEPREGRGAITIVKEALPDSPQDFQFVGNLGEFLLDDDADPTLPRQRTFRNLRPGVYNVTEPDLGDNVEPYELTDIRCRGGAVEVQIHNRQVQIRLEAGEHVTCVFVNEAPLAPPPGRGAITIVKEAIPDSPLDFQFVGNLGDFLLDDDDDPTLPRSRTFADLEPGVYNVTEPDLGEGTEPYELTDIVCGGGEADVRVHNRQVQIRLEEGQHVRCIFVNEAPPQELGSITITKDVIGDSGRTFRFVGDLGQFALDDDPASDVPNQRRFAELVAGRYRIREVVPPGWRVRAVTCTEQQGPEIVIDLAIGQDLTCTFVNVEIPVVKPGPGGGKPGPGPGPGPGGGPDVDVRGGAFVRGDGELRRGAPRKGPGALAVTGTALGLLGGLSLLLVSGGGATLGLGRARARHAPPSRRYRGRHRAT